MNKKLSKVISLFLSVVVLITSTSFAQAPKVQYADIKGHWAEAQMSDWINKELIKGLGDNTYGPNNGITRAEFVTLINRIYSFEEKTEVNFSDVTDTKQWYYDEVAKAIKADYIKGSNNGTFMPAAAITRQEVAAIISRIQNLDVTVNEEVIKGFSDAASIPDWSKGYISAVVSKKYMLGAKNGSETKINPAKNMTRAEAVTMVDRASTVYTPAPIEKQYNDLFDAIAKTQQVTSMQQKSNISLGFNATGLSEEDAEMMNLISEMLGNISIETNSKLIQNTEKTALKSQIVAKISAGSEVDISTIIWSDYDISANGTKLKQVIEIPEFLAGFLPDELADKKYMIADENVGSPVPSADFEKLMNMSKKLEAKLGEFIKSFVLESDNKYNIINDLRSKVVETADGQLQIADAYQITISDATFKAMLKDMIGNAEQNKELISLFQDYLNISMSLSGEGGETIDFSQFKDDLNKFMDAIEDVKIIGDKGLVMSYAIDKDGYIINTMGSVDLVFDIAKLSDAMAELDDTYIPGEEQGVFNINLKFSNINYDMNKQMTISFPETNASNSFNASELDKLMEEEIIQEEVTE